MGCGNFRTISSQTLSHSRTHSLALFPTLSLAHWQRMQRRQSSLSIPLTSKHDACWCRCWKRNQGGWWGGSCGNRTWQRSSSSSKRMFCYIDVLHMLPPGGVRVRVYVCVNLREQIFAHISRSSRYSAEQRCSQRAACCDDVFPTAHSVVRTVRNEVRFG